MTYLRLTLRTCCRPHGQLERDSGPHYRYDTFIYRHENCTLAVKKEHYSVWRSCQGSWSHLCHHQIEIGSSRPSRTKVGISLGNFTIYHIIEESLTFDITTSRRRWWRWCWTYSSAKFGLKASTLYFYSRQAIRYDTNQNHCYHRYVEGAPFITIWCSVVHGEGLWARFWGLEQIAQIE